MDIERIRGKMEKIHTANTKQVSALITRDFDLSHLNTILDPEVAEIYRRLIPRHAELCELNQTRKLTELERCDLAVSYASLYPTFGHEGIVVVAAHYLASRPNRQARDN
jgi:hypothetical protein